MSKGELIDRCLVVGCAIVFIGSAITGAWLSAGAMIIGVALALVRMRQRRAASHRS
jgi:hypothetical protein